MIDLGKSVVVRPDDATGPERRAVAMMVEEVERRSRIRWRSTSEWPKGDMPVIAVGRPEGLKSLTSQFQEEARKGGPRPAEGYRIRVKDRGGRPIVFIVGNDARGVLFGVGRLLRALHMNKESVTLPDDLDITTAPRYRLRGHQLGYRDKTNSYCGWDLDQWEQYIRDLAVFGANAIELIPPRSDDNPDSVHFPRPPLEMMEGMSRLADGYGMDVWIWYPAMDEDYTDPATVEYAVEEWASVFRRLPRIDEVMVPGGDPGRTRPKVLMSLLEKQAASLRSYHPEAGMWVSPQGFSDEWMAEFVGILEKESPDWLDGVAFGPWIHMTTAEFREMIPGKYPIRHYPDITHNLSCQYPIPEWDVAYAVTEGREIINPRPRDQLTIFQGTQAHTIGFLAYSEGCHDDVNKAIWSGLGWDPDQDVADILREYSRYFIGDELAEDFAEGLMDLERNWDGPLSENKGVYETLERFQGMERAASPRHLKNWRFQQGLYRAYYDAYVRSRLVYETSLEEEATAELRQAREVGSLAAMERAEAVLDSAQLGVSRDWRTRIYQLAEALFQSIHMQLSVDLYRAQAEVRGANLDGVDYPLNNAPWLKSEFGEIRDLPDEERRLDAIGKIIHWTDPGPGGFYDNLGSSFQHPHVVTGPGFERDPGLWRSAFRQYPYTKNPQPLRLAWRGGIGTLKDTPFEMRYTGLDRDVAYKVRMVYADLSPDIEVRLEANGYRVHDWMTRDGSPHPVEFDIPVQATRNGNLSLRWHREPGKGGAGRGCQISEIWLMKK